jgi:hypothetical protein
MKEFRPTQWISLEESPNEWVNQQDMETFHKQKVEQVPKAVGSEVFSVDVSKVLNTSDVAGAKSLERANERAKPAPIKAFLSYAHADERWRAKLEPYLIILQRKELLTLWCDHEIKPGHLWDDEIKQKLEEAELYILLMSPALLASAYVHTIELPIALRRVQGKQARVVPVVLKDCSWKDDFGKFQALPSNGRPIKKFPDTAFYDVEMGLQKAIEEMQDAFSVGDKL